jgi:hypothetical protein
MFQGARLWSPTTAVLNRREIQETRNARSEISTLRTMRPAWMNAGGAAVRVCIATECL